MLSQPKNVFKPLLNDGQDVIAKMLRHGEKPAKSISDLYEYGRVFENSLLNSYGGFIEHFEHGLDVAIKQSEAINYVPKSDWGEDKIMSWFFLNASIKSLWAGFIALKSGFPNASITILRDALEGISKAFWAIGKDESQNLNCIIDNKLQSNKKIPSFGPFEFLNGLSCELGHLYNLVSKFSHGQVYQVSIERMNLQKQHAKDGKHGRISIRKELDAESVPLFINCSEFLLLLIINAFWTIFLKKNENDIPKQLFPKVKEATEDTISGLRCLLHGAGEATRHLSGNNNWDVRVETLFKYLEIRAEACRKNINP